MVENLHKPSLSLPTHEVLVPEPEKHSTTTAHTLEVVVGDAYGFAMVLSDGQSFGSKGKKLW